MPAKCRIDHCDGEGTCCIDYMFLGERNGVQEKLHKIIQPYCLGCAAGVIAALQVGMPPILFLRLTDDMVQAGYAVSGEGWHATARPIGEAFKGEYVPAPGKCHHRNCPNDATVRPVVIFPLSQPKGTEAYSLGDPVCNQHIRERLNLGSIDPGSLREAVTRMVSLGHYPILYKIRVEPRLLEWTPPGVMITEDISQDARTRQVQGHISKSQNSGNN